MVQWCKRLRNAVQAMDGSVVGEATRASRENCPEKGNQPGQKQWKRRHYHKNKTTILEENKKPNAKKKRRAKRKTKISLEKKHRFR